MTIDHDHDHFYELNKLLKTKKVVIVIVTSHY